MIVLMAPVTAAGIAADMLVVGTAIVIGTAVFAWLCIRVISKVIGL